MTVAELHDDETLRLREFPVAARRIFLAHGGVAPLPRRVAEAVAAMATAGSLDDQEAALPAGWVHEIRVSAARLLGAAPEEIALVGPTSLALSFVAGGLEWRPGQNVVVCQEDYPANVYPWMALGARGVEVRCFLPRTPGRIQPSDIFRQVDEHTRLVALSSAHFISGWRPDLDALGGWLRARGVMLCLDAIQTLGALPTDVGQVDFLAADSHKWLLGPTGAGILYVRRPMIERVQPIVFGWHNVRCPDFLAQDDLRLRPDARRYEAGSHNLLGLAGLKAALELVHELGLEAIAAKLAEHRAYLLAELAGRGCEVLGANGNAERADSSARAGAAVSFLRPGVDMRALHARLAEQGVMTSLRTTRDRRHWVRLTPHYYNTRAELVRAMELVFATG